MVLLPLPPPSPPLPPLLFYPSSLHPSSFIPPPSTPPPLLPPPLILTTNKTGVFQHGVLLVLLGPEVSKRVDDDAKDEVLDDDDDYQEEEGKIVEDSQEKQSLLQRGEGGCGHIGVCMNTISLVPKSDSLRTSSNLIKKIDTGFVYSFIIYSCFVYYSKLCFP